MNETISYGIRQERSGDGDEISRLTHLGFGAAHARRAIWLLRHGEPVPTLCLVAELGGTPDNGESLTSGNPAGGINKAGTHLCGSIRYWPASIGSRPGLVLGPLAVEPDRRGMGIGVALVRQSLEIAKAGKWEWCFVSGEPNYYLKFGFVPVSYDDISLPAPIEVERLHLMALPAADLDAMPPKPWNIAPATHDTKPLTNPENTQKAG